MDSPRRPSKNPDYVNPAPSPDQPDSRPGKDMPLPGNNVESPTDTPMPGTSPGQIES
jgi:hypothetical protein